MDATYLYVASLPSLGVALFITHMVEEDQLMIVLPGHKKEDYTISKTKSTTFRSWLSSVPDKPLL